MKKMDEHWKLEIRAKDEESSALKRALENKIDQIISLEKEIKQLKKDEETIQNHPPKNLPVSVSKEYNSMASHLS